MDYQCDAKADNNCMKHTWLFGSTLLVGIIGVAISTIVNHGVLHIVGFVAEIAGYSVFVAWVLMSRWSRWRNN